MSEARQRLMLGALGVAVTLAVWELVGQRLGPELLAPPSTVARDYVELVRAGTMLHELAVSLRQMLLGFALACAVGMPLGAAMGRSRAADLALHPWVGMFVVTSVAALVPLLILMFGTGLAFRVAVVFLSSVWYVTLATYGGARGVDPRLIAVARSFAASRSQVFSKVIVPALYPHLVTGARIGLVHAIRGMVVAEMFVIIGYGGLIHLTGLMVETGPLLGLLVSLMLVSIAATALLRRIGRRLAPWYEERQPGLG